MDLIWFKNRNGIVMSVSVPVHRGVQAQIDQGELTVIDPPTLEPEAPKRGRGRPPKVRDI